MRQIMVALSEAGHRVWRVNAGKGWVGPTKRHSDGSVTIRHAQPFFGVPEGVADLMGLCRDGVFLAVEVKTETGRPTLNQTAYLNMVAAMGGRAGIARSVGEALRIASGT